MADVFISYRNTPERRFFVRRLAAILRAYNVSVWWDYGLEAGESFRAQITGELAKARIVSPLWCAQSVVSKWVAMEAELGKDKLVPARLQKVRPPQAFEAIQAADLIGWDGAIGHPRVVAFVRKICERLGKPPHAPTDMIEELTDLRALTPLPEVEGAAPGPVSAPAHDFGFWKAEWEAYRASDDPAALRAIAEHAPPYFADKARARMDEIKAREADGRIKVGAKIIHGAPDGWFKPGAGKSEWFKDHEHGPEMVVVPPGQFMMGSNDYDSEKPPHKVTIKAPLAVGRFASTFDEWDAAGLAHKPSDQGWGRGKQPVINVSWEDAKAYAKWLSQKTGETYRLLSEAEWEYVARAGTTTAFWWGDSISTQEANYDGNHTFGGGQKGEYRQRTVPVDSFAPNPWGLHQVHGNVWEWIEDNWHADYKGAPQGGSVWQGGDVSLRVLRGGSWLNNPDYCRSAYRNWVPPVNRSINVGFRLARTL